MTRRENAAGAYALSCSPVARHFLLKENEKYTKKNYNPFFT